MLNEIYLYSIQTQFVTSPVHFPQKSDQKLCRMRDISAGDDEFRNWSIWIFTSTQKFRWLLDNSDIQRADIRFPVFQPHFKTLGPRKSTNKWILKWRPVVCEKFTKHANNFLNFAFLMTLGHNFQPCMYYFKGIFSELKANGIEWDSIKIQRLITSRSIVEKCSEVLAKITNQSNRDKDNKCFKRTIRTREGGPTNVTEITKMTNLVKTRA